MRYVIAFDAATEHVAVGLAALGADGSLATVAAVDFSAPRAALGRLLPAVEELLVAAGVSREDISAVAVGRGPGSFTGVRIAVASAKGLAHGLGVPLVGLGTLDAVAWRFADRDAVIGVVGDAMRGEVYPCRFRCGAGQCERLDPYHVAKPADAAAEWVATADVPTILAGNGLAKYRDIFSAALGGAVIADEALWTPTGASVVAAAFAEHDEPSLAAVLGDPGRALERANPGVLLPVYTRLSDAEEAETRRIGATPGSGVAGPSGGAS
jgi:N6-L-threonylcarbamoyladenine synthase/protein kinase Bud32